MLPTADQVLGFTPPPYTPATAWSLRLNAGLAASAILKQNGAISPFLRASRHRLKARRPPALAAEGAVFNRVFNFDPIWQLEWRSVP